MGDKSGISWTDATWNPVVGCTKVSAGCKNCYAEAAHTMRHEAKMAAETEGAKNLPVQYDEPFTTVQLKPERLDMPLRWRRPRRVFANSVSDLFHERVPDAFIDRVFAVMALAPRHTFQILTKRPERMAGYLSPERMATRELAILAAMREFVGHGAPFAGKGLTEHMGLWERLLPLPNVWLGTSVENSDAVGRADWLRRTPAAVRFVSAEPLIGPLVRSKEDCPRTRVGDGQQCVRRLGHPGDCAVEWGSTTADFGEWPPELDLEGIDWVIVGGESGRKWRPMDHDWARSIRDACVAEGVAFFFKQSAGPQNERGRLLDGERWEQMPELAGAVVAP